MREIAIRESKKAHDGKIICARCNRECSENWEGDDPMKAEADHIVPLNLGGKNEVSNLQVLCRGCHSEKTRLDRREIAKANRKEKVEKQFTPLSRFGFEFASSPASDAQTAQKEGGRTSEKPQSESTSEDKQ